MPEDGLLLEVADAVASGESVDWERSAARATGTRQRRALENLRTIAAILQVQRIKREPAVRARPDDARRWRLMDLMLAALVTVSALQSGVALVIAAGLIASGAPAARFVVPKFAIIATFSVASALLIIGGRHDYRARLLGAVFALIASAFARPYLSGPLVGLHAATFLPASLWLFAREFPRVHRFSGIDTIARRMTTLSVIVGGILWSINILPLRPIQPLIEPLNRSYPFRVYWVLIGTLMLGALGAIAFRGRAASGEEQRRVRVFIAGFVLATAPLLIDSVVELLIPEARAFAARWRTASAILVFGSVLSMPFTMVYAVLAEGALDIRLVIRRSYQRLLARQILTLGIVVPIVALAWLLVSQADHTVAFVMSETNAKLWMTCLVGSAALAVLRRQLLAHLDRWVYPAVRDQQDLLAWVGAQLMHARLTREIGKIIIGAAGRGTGASNMLLLAAGPPEALHYSPVAGPGTPLPQDSAVAFALASTRQPLFVDPDDPASVFRLLPDDAAQWVVETNAALAVPLIGSDAELRGMLVAGRRIDEQRLTSDDAAFLAALAAAAGLALEGLRLRDSPKLAAEQEAASECPRCHAVGMSGEVYCSCGVPHVEAPLPKLLAGKLRIDQRLGAGGMGVVYLAQDLTLNRPVAIKTLPGATSVEGLLTLKQEARSMAAVTHPAIAQIHSLETWHERPLLVVEYLAGGTLARRQLQGPLEVSEAVRIALAIAGALERVHDAGYLHRDVKPSNIGFAKDNTVKLLDFGLAQLAGDPLKGHGGTLLYLSPEVLDGAPAGPADDVWALSVVLYEMLAGVNPFRGGSPADVADRVRAVDIPSLAACRPDLPKGLTAAVEATLDRNPRLRARSAHEFISLVATPAPDVRIEARAR